jgi:hypothetical protein
LSRAYNYEINKKYRTYCENLILKHGVAAHPASSSPNFFSLIVFGGTEVPIVYILLCHPSEDSIQQSSVVDLDL